MGELEKDKEIVVEAEKELVDTKTEEKRKVEKSKKKKKDRLEDTLETIENELKAVKDKYLRTLAEMENFKKRMNEDLKKERKYAGYSMANKLIDSIEIFNQTLNMETNDPNLKNFLYGFKMIDDMIYGAMKEEGVSVIETKIGDDFDPTIHDAMDREYDPEKPLHTVLKIVKRGYRFKDRLLRPCLIIINMKPDEKDEDLETKEENSENTENITEE